MNILRNFFVTLRTYKGVLLLNILGLAVALSVAYMISVQVYFEVSYNKGIKDSDRIACVIFNSKDAAFFADKWRSFWWRPLIENQKQNITAEDIAIINLSPYPSPFACEKSSSSGSLAVSEISLSALDMFGFECVEGSADDLQSIKNIAISESVARKWGLSLGDRISLKTDTFVHSAAQTVAAIYRDFPRNCDLHKIGAVMNIPEENEPTTNLVVRSYSYGCYVKLREGYTTADFDSIAAEVHDSKSFGACKFRSETLDNLYFSDKMKVVDSTSRQAFSMGEFSEVLTLIIIGVVLVVIAFVNYLNFFLSLMPRRIRSVNTQRIMGASVFSLRFSFLIESFLLVSMSLFIAWLITDVVAKSSLASFFSVSVAVCDNISVAFVAVLVTLLLSFVTAIYPALYVTSFTPALAMKGSFGHSKSSVIFRNLLLLLQFFISFGLITLAVFIWWQNSCMMNADMGFDKEAVLVTSQVKGRLRGLAMYDELSDKLKQHPSVKDVTYAEKFFVVDRKSMVGSTINGPRPENYEDKAFEGCPLEVSWNFLSFMGIEVYEGRDFQPDDYVLSSRNADNIVSFARGALITNECAKNKYQITTENRCGVAYPNAPFIGFCRDFNFQPLQYEITPMVFCLSHDMRSSHIYLKVAPNCNLDDVTAHVRSCINDFFETDEGDGITVQYFDELLQMLYEDEQRTAQQITVFAIIAIMVSVMGLFATVLFEVKDLEREIAVRRVHGATVADILGLINGKYVRITLLAFVSSLFFAVYAVYRWLQEFAYQTPLHWWLFAAVLFAVLAIVVAVVSFTSWHVASRNPVEVINRE